MEVCFALAVEQQVPYTHESNTLVPIQIGTASSQRPAAW